VGFRVSVAYYLMVVVSGVIVVMEFRAIEEFI
jgi:hypothetical protein